MTRDAQKNEENSMKIGRVTGTVVSTIKYADYRGYKLLKVRPIALDGVFAGEEVVALDAAGAGIGDTVLINNDGGSAQLVMNDKQLIACVTVCGVVDHYTYNGITIHTH
jgi:microcompartment protein CcmK/EutM